MHVIIKNNINNNNVGIGLEKLQRRKNACENDVCMF